ncbi:MAG: hypothetical protein JRG91_16350, partial [Deltaproteobacteria bacterium]|nr:hypothetical protein [Deltaproteobacteria bacterium]
MTRWTCILLASALLLFPSCKKDHGDEADADTDGDAETDADAAPVCEFADDGVCDEPANCALGTDEDDCVAACASGENLHLFAAACAHRDPPEVPPDDGDPSGGALHLTGVRDGTLRIAMGDAPGRPIDRHYRIFVPKAYDPDRSTPLVIMMPGHRVSHYGLAGYTNLFRTADQNNFIVVDAEQQFRGTGERRWAWFTDWDWAGET